MNTASKTLVALALVGAAVAGGVKYYPEIRYGAPDLANGQTQYVDNCAACHGNRGLGDGLVSASLSVSPDSIYDELNNPWGLKLELMGSVLDGDNGQGGMMPAFRGVLSEQDIHDIFGYIESVND
ncbi:c-type cytochrome [Vibrio sp. WXL103]|uniref:c-type cytochrome n=1 Tax=Vibrio sp. WXL103 TaxID=3450710 RepID=UPI003EC87FB7